MKKNATIIIFIFLITACGNNTEYKNDLQELTDSMMDNAGKAEDLISQYSNVWKFSIESGSAIEIDSMVAKTGINKDDVIKHFEINLANNIPNDFSTNIHSLISYFESTGAIEDIKQNSADAKNKLKEMNKTPKDLEKAYHDVLELYDLTEKYIEMAINPTGSLQDYTSNANQLSSDIISQYKKLEISIPD